MNGVETRSEDKAATKADASTRPLRILVVDDNKPFAESLAWVLEAASNTVEIAHNGPDALEIARRLDPDVVLLDILLPVMDGYEVCRQLRAQSGNPDLKIIAQSGYDDMMTEADRRKACFDLYLVKPIDIRQVVALIGGIRKTRRGRWS
jgi:CheY-like chemotaxis protein